MGEQADGGAAERVWFGIYEANIDCGPDRFEQWRYVAHFSFSSSTRLAFTAESYRLAAWPAEGALSSEVATALACWKSATIG